MEKPKFKTNDLVYVVELEQPFENWSGVIESYNGNGFYNVVNAVDDVTLVHENQLSLLEDDKQEKNKKFYIETLTQRGLSEEEAKQFLQLVSKLKPTEDDLKNREKEFNEGIPYEGGMFLKEVITELYLLKL